MYSYLEFSVFGDDEKHRAEFKIQKDALLNVGSELRERIGRRLLAMRAQLYRP